MWQTFNYNPFPIQKCMQAARELGAPIFALKAGKCLIQGVLEDVQLYKTQGPCVNGQGADTAMSVYTTDMGMYQSPQQ